MRKYIRLISIGMGCLMSLATYAEPPAASETAIPVVATTEKVENSVTATLTLTQENKRLYARVFMQQSKSMPGKITVEWTPPVNSYCVNSRYELAYRGKQFHTHCYRTLNFIVKNKALTCSGLWQVVIKNSEGIELAKANFDAPSN